MSLARTPSKSDALFETYAGVTFNDPGAEAFSAVNPDRVDALFFYKPIQDEVLNLIDIALRGGGALKVRNETGSTLTAGTPVNVSGWNETQGRFKVVAANATGAVPAHALLLADLTTATNGIAYIGGLMTDVLNTSGSAEGNAVYLAAGGGLTLTAPSSADTIVQIVGRVRTVAAAGEVQGLIQVPTKIGTSWYQDLSVTDGKLATSYIKADGTRAFTGNQSMGGFKLTNVLDPTSAQDAVTKAYADNIAAGMKPKSSCRLRTTSIGGGVYNSTGGTSGRGQLTGMSNANIDGVAPAAGNRIFVDNSVASAGIWVITTLGSGADGVWDRATDFDTDAEVTSGAFFSVEEGTSFGNMWYFLTTDNPITIGGGSGTSLIFTQFNGLGQVTAGEGLTKVGNTLHFDLSDLTGEASIAAADQIPFYDASVPGNRKITFAELGTAMAGAGLTSTNGILALDITDLTLEGTIDGAADSIAFYDASATATRKTTIAALATLFAGSGLTATNGVIALDINDIGNTETSIADDDLVGIYDTSAAATDKITRANLFKQPCARVYNTSTDSIADNTFETLSFNSETYDTDTIHDTGTNPERLTCKTAGKYSIIGNVQFAAHATGNRIAVIRKNGTTEIARTQVPACGGGFNTQVCVVTQVDLAVNDYVELRVYQNSGGALNVNASASPGTGEQDFMMARISA